MKNKIIILLSSITIMLIALNIVSAIGTIQESYNAGDDGFTSLFDDGIDREFRSQWFNVGLNASNSFTIGQVALKLEKQGTPPATFAINITSANRTGYPNMSNVISSNISIATADVSTLAGGAWINITMPSAVLTKGNNYTIFIYMIGGDSGNRLKVRKQAVSSYPFGFYDTANGGISWTYNSGTTIMFEVYNTTATGGTFPIGTPSVTLNYPPNNTAFTSLITFNASLTPINSNITNATIYIWNSTGGIVNQTFNVLNSNTTINTLFNISNLNAGAYTWNVEGCASNLTASACNTAPSNFSFTQGLQINNAMFTTPVTETTSQQFVLNVNNSIGLVFGASYLNYAGVNYVAFLNSGGTQSNYTTTLTIPQVNATTVNYFFWNITVSSPSGNPIQFISSTYNQTIDPLILIACNTTYPTITLNFTFYDEILQKNVNASESPTNLLLNFKYWMGNGAIKKYYSFQALNSSSNNFQFCLSPNVTLYVDMDMQYYYATGFADRTYYLRNYTLTNAKQDILLYSLISSKATKFSVTLKQGTDLVTGAVVSVYKYFVGLGSYKLVMIGLTDDKGQFSANLDLDQNYNFSIMSNNVNEGSIIKQGSCTTAPCTIDLNIGEAILSPLDSLSNYIAQNVVYTLSYNATLKTVNLTFEDKLGTAQYWRLWVYQPNYGNESTITICDIKTFSTLGLMGCDYSNYTGNIVAKVYISRSPEKLVDFLNLVNNNASTILGETGILASIIILLVIVFSATRNPVNALILIPFALVILKFIGFLPLEWTWITALTIFIIWIIGRLNT